ncbi:hypothetical protein [uncultured Shewanella sp.]|uniref:hypothetical protein n=1 Tax=uncultured Shewanella sp. TaxID=173975 RepID=UPI002603F721|nr:hypothetical protein [uncultured Shewanella sp.]
MAEQRGKTKISELKQGEAILAVLKEYKLYALETMDAADLPYTYDFHVMHSSKKDQSAIILIAEAHDSTHEGMYPLAKACAETLLKISGVKVAVEEPMIDKASGRLFANAGTTAEKIADCIKSGVSIFNEDKGIPTNAASIIHQLFDLMPNDDARFPAEPLANTLLNRKDDKINKDMAKTLADNTSDTDITVYPVGRYHFSEAYAKPTLLQRIMELGYQELT